MQTALANHIKGTSQGVEADAILRSCVHCGFCLATCPTYQLLGDERDSPRGRIYLIKEMLEGEPVSSRTQLHLDRCLTCRACETTCPSGVEYTRLLDIGRGMVEARVPRAPWARLGRYLLRRIVAYPRRFALLAAFARPFAPFLPRRLRIRREPAPPRARPTALHARRMLMLGGCVQPVVRPGINVAAARVFDALGITLREAPAAGCCGAIAHHLAAHADARAHARRNVDAWWPDIEAGAEAIVVTASGCVATLKEYGRLLAAEPAYAARAAQVSALIRDVSEIVAGEATELRAALATAAPRAPASTLAFHSPCSLQHGSRLRGVVESLLRAAGYSLTPVADGHSCCGSAGSYSILQPELSAALLERKLEALQNGAPSAIATANIGCLMHLESAASVPVRHWIELLAERLHR